MSEDINWMDLFFQTVKVAEKREREAAEKLDELRSLLEAKERDLMDTQYELAQQRKASRELLEDRAEWCGRALRAEQKLEELENKEHVVSAGQRGAKNTIESLQELPVGARLGPDAENDVLVRLPDGTWDWDLNGTWDWAWLKGGGHKLEDALRDWRGSWAEANVTLPAEGGVMSVSDETAAWVLEKLRLAEERERKSAESFNEVYEANREVRHERDATLAENLALGDIIEDLKERIDFWENEAEAEGRSRVRLQGELSQLEDDLQDSGWTASNTMDGLEALQPGTKLGPDDEGDSLIKDPNGTWRWDWFAPGHGGDLKTMLNGYQGDWWSKSKVTPPEDE